MKSRFHSGFDVPLTAGLHQHAGATAQLIRAVGRARKIEVLRVTGHFGRRTAKATARPSHAATFARREAS